MCHSVEIYLPRITERMAERRIGAEVRSASEAQLWAGGAIGALLARLKAVLRGHAAGTGLKEMQERLSDA